MKGKPVLFLIGLVISAFTPPAWAAASPRPNLIVVMGDDLASWAIGAYGNREVVTPHIDKLATEGARFGNAFVTTPVCSPSRTSYLTGLHSIQHGITDYLTGGAERAGMGLPLKVATWPQVLQKSGYTTALIGKWHVGKAPQHHPNRRGFDHFFGMTGGFAKPMDPVLEENGSEKEYKGPIADIMTDNAMAFVEKNRERPFALLLNFREPHLPYVPAAPVDEAVYKNKKLTIAQFPGTDPAELLMYTRQYNTLVHAIDRNMGRLVAKLDALGLTENTIVVVTSDHGYMIGEHGLHSKGNAWWLNKGVPYNTKRPNMFDLAIRIPLIVKWPGVTKPGTVLNQFVTNVDMYASFLGMLGVSVPKTSRHAGADFSPLLRGKEVKWRDAVFADYDMYGGALAYMRMIRTDKWKLVRHYFSHELSELFDLENDPGETKNLYRDKKYDSMREELQTRLMAWQKKMKDPILPRLAKEQDPYKK